MSAPPDLTGDAAAACALLAALPQEAALPDAAMQAALAALIKRYAVRVESDPGMDPFPPGNCVTATDAMMAVTGILRALNLQAFELGMWQNWVGRH